MRKASLNGCSGCIPSAQKSNAMGHVTRLSRRFKQLLCYAIVLLVTGCSGNLLQTIQISSMAQKKQHHQIIQTLQPQVEQNNSLSAFDLFILSGAYYEIRDYQRCLNTAHLMQTRIDQGESSYLGGNLTPYPHLMQGLVHLDQGSYTQAIDFAEQAYRLISSPTGRSNPWFSSQLIQTAEVAGVAQALQGNLSEARRWLTTVQQLPIDSSGIQGPDKYIAIARINMALKDYQGVLAALRHPQAKVTGLITTLYDQTFQELPRLFIETKALFETGALQQARQGYDQLLQHPQIKEIGGIYWPVLFDRARIARSEADLQLAEQLLQQAVEVVELQRATITTEAGRIGFVGDKQALYRELVDLLISRGKVSQAFAYTERAKSRALVDLLASAGTAVQPLTQTAQLQTTITRLSQLEQESAIVGDEATRSASTSHSRGLIATLKKELTQQAPAYASLVSVNSLSAAETQLLLRPDETLLEFYGEGDTWYLFVLSRQTISGRKLSLSNPESTVRKLRSQLATPDSGTAYQETARELYRQLLGSLEGQLTERMVIVPHGILHYLPFSTLINSSGKALLESHTIRVLPAAGITAYLKPLRRTTPVTALILGNPQLEDQRLSLLHAQEEARAIAALLPGSTLLLGAAATRSALISQAGDHQLLHIAAHGVFQADTPLHSALLLAQINNDDGLLRAADLYRLRLNADLVTLSACETALSSVANGDDLLGFTRGFLYAGARSIISSLWKVDDRATRDLMLAFYQNLQDMDKVQALTRAQRAIRQQLPHPFYWAAFQLTGAPD